MSHLDNVQSGAKYPSSVLITGVLITGGAGFIGTHLCRALVKKGYRVRVLDLVRPLTPVAGVEYLQGDVSNAKDLERAFEDTAFDSANSFASALEGVFHFAAVSSVPACEEDPALGYRTNLVGTALLLEHLRNRQTQTGKKIKAVFSGSSAVYGTLGDEHSPLEESLSLPFPLSNYAIQKLAAERLFRTFYQAYGIPSVVFRFFNVYGSGQDPKSPYTGVITTFLARLRSGQPIMLHGGGMQTRDFVSVTDIVEACVRALSLDEASCNGSPMNLASGQKINIRDLAELLMRITGCDVPLYITESRQGDVQNSMANISLAKQVLGWAPGIKLEQGLKSLCETSIAVAPQSPSQSL